MAKKSKSTDPSTPASSPPVKVNRSVSNQATREKTLGKILDLGKSVAKSALAETDPFVDVPSRTMSNTTYNEVRKLLQMGDATLRRNLFNTGQARKFMQMVLLSKGCKDLLQAQKR